LYYLISIVAAFSSFCNSFQHFLDPRSELRSVSNADPDLNHGINSLQAESSQDETEAAEQPLTENNIANLITEDESEESDDEEIFEDSMDFNPGVGGEEPLLDDSSDHSPSDLSRDELPVVVSSPSLSR
jgi:hypothetical protein